MFQDLKKHRHIFVTGPHRSGTTICARMIAQDTGHDLIIEDEFNRSNLALLAAFIQADYAPSVIQCPFLANIIHDLNYLIELDMQETLVVFMHRYVKDIIDSEMRSPVAFELVSEHQQEEYNFGSIKLEQHISDFKYESWEEQRESIPHYLDQGYEALRNHPLWLDARAALPFEHVMQPPKFPAMKHALSALQDL